MRTGLASGQIPIPRTRWTHRRGRASTLLGEAGNVLRMARNAPIQSPGGSSAGCGSCAGVMLRAANVCSHRFPTAKNVAEIALLPLCSVTVGVDGRSEGRASAGPGRSCDRVVATKELGPPKIEDGWHFDHGRLGPVISVEGGAVRRLRHNSSRASSSPTSSCCPAERARSSASWAVATALSNRPAAANATARVSRLTVT
jgi:hypothetical protein